MIVQTIVPGDFSVPFSRNHAAPLTTIPGTLASDSRFSASVGGASDSPPPDAISTCAGDFDVGSRSPACSTTSSTPWRHGGAMRGNGGRPSIASSSAVSSP